MSSSWTREQITYCRCDTLSYVHTHCPCIRCKGKAVSRSTEYRHWQEANAESIDTSMCSATALIENSATCITEVPAEPEVTSSTEGILSSQLETNVEQGNDASVEFDALEGPHSLPEQLLMHLSTSHVH